MNATRSPRLNWPAMTFVPPYHSTTISPAPDTPFINGGNSPRTRASAMLSSRNRRLSPANTRFCHSART